MNCKVEGCNGFFGPGCMVTWPHPLYHKCQGNKDFWTRVWNSTKELYEQSLPPLTEADVEPF